MATAEKYIRAVDNAADYADSQVESREQASVEALDALYRGEDMDEELWRVMKAGSAYTML